MKKHIIRSIGILTVLTMVFQPVILTGCSGKTEETETSTEELTSYEILHEPEFGGIYIKISIDDFNALGYEYGDSVDLSFSNGYKLDDIPYYNGFYTVIGDPLIVAYPGYEYIKACVNLGDDLWLESGVGITDTATITLREKGKYLDIQEAHDIHYTDVREDYPSDEVFANFRSVNVGNLKKDILYRSASPCDNQHNRASYVDALAKEAGIGCIIDLADNEDKVASYIEADDFNSPYFLSLLEGDNVILLGLNAHFGCETFNAGVCDGLLEMAQREGPFLIHCTEGKDRTGFILLLLEAFAGATYDEIVDDYMITYANYYGITKEKEPAKYETIRTGILEPMLYIMTGDESVDLKTCDLSVYAEDYIRECGLDDSEIAALRSRLCG